MPLKKGTPAYEARLARRRAQRKINRLEKQKKETGIGTRTAMNLQLQINELKEGIKSTYQKVAGKRVRSAAEVVQNLRKLESYSPSVQTQRRNIQASRELSNATKPENAGTSKYSEGDVHIFFAATIRAWQGKPASERMQSIMEYYHVSDLGAFIDYVLEQNKLAREIYSGDVAAADVTDDSELYQEAAKKDSADKEKYDSLYMSFIMEITPRDVVL